MNVIFPSITAHAPDDWAATAPVPLLIPGLKHICKKAFSKLQINRANFPVSRVMRHLIAGVNRNFKFLIWKTSFFSSFVQQQKCGKIHSSWRNYCKKFVFLRSFLFNLYFSISYLAPVSPMFILLYLLPCSLVSHVYCLSLSISYLPPLSPPSLL